MKLEKYLDLEVPVNEQCAIFICFLYFINNKILLTNPMCIQCIGYLTLLMFGSPKRYNYRINRKEDDEARNKDRCQEPT